MAVLDARASTVDFQMGELADTSASQFISGAPTVASWFTVNGDVLRAAGSGFVFSGGLAMAGTVSTVRLDLAGSSAPDGTFDIKISGLALPLTALTASNLQPQLPLFWDRMLGGDDTLYSPLSGDNVMFGDGLWVHSATGGAVTGGNDFIRVAGSAFGTYIGDFAGSDEQVIGGNDYLVTTSTLGASLYGDLGVFNGTGLCQGGADVLRANQASIADPRLFNSLIGDVQTVMDGTFVGGADAILGSNAARDWIIGDAENCMAASATGGDDELYGGAGPDTVYGDFVNLLSPTAQCGNDRILGDAGSDLLVGDVKDVNQSKEGILFGQDAIFGGEGNDRIYGDYRFSSVAETSLYRPLGQDYIDCGNGDDFAYGQINNDTILGGDGSDFLSGGIAHDHLDGGTGNDTLVGGADKDVYVFKAGYRADIVLDFQDAADKLDLSGFAFPGFVDVFAKALMNGNNLEINFGAGDILTLFNFSITKFDAADVIL